MENSLQLVLVLLLAAVLVVIVFRLLKLPALIGYLLGGVAIVPRGLGLIPDTAGTRGLAEFGVVFLMFSIGLEFSLARLATMRRIVFGLGASQVALTLAIVVAAALGAGADWRAGVVLGGAIAMSSTAIVSKMLAEKLELNTLHGRQVIGVLLFQDLAVVPLLILIPALAQHPDDLGAELMLALLKAAVVLSILLYFGQRPMRAWFHLVARQKSSELFVLNVLLITLGLAYVTEFAGLSLALGAFVAGMLISETEYRYQVEGEIKPFRDVLLGLFFVTVGMKLDIPLVLGNVLWVALALLALIVLKALLIGGLSRLFGSDTGAAARTGLDLAQGGEFGFVLLSLAAPLNLVPEAALQTALAAMVLSMLAGHALVLLGVPFNRVLRRIRDARAQRYSLLRGYFHGATDAAEDAAHKAQKLLHSVLIAPGAAAIGRTLDELNLARLEVEVKAVRRHNVHAQAPQPDARIEAGDVLVLLGSEQNCAAAEMKLMQG